MRMKLLEAYELFMRLSFGDHDDNDGGLVCGAGLISDSDEESNGTDPSSSSSSLPSNKVHIAP